MTLTNLHKRIGLPALTSFAAVAAAVAIAACGGSSAAGSHTSVSGRSSRSGSSGAKASNSNSSSSSGSSSSSSPASSLALTRAADVSSAAQGYKLSLKLRESVDGENVDISGYGSASPAARQADITMNIGGAATSLLGNLKLTVVLDKQMLYVKLPTAISGELTDGKPWVVANLAQLAKAANIPGVGTLLSSSSSISNPSQYLEFLRAASAGSVRDLGPATVDGVATTRYSADIDLARLPDMVPTADRAAIEKLVSKMDAGVHVKQLPVQAWIDGAHRIRRLQVSYSVTASGQTVKATIVEDIRSYGPQPAPPVPSASQTTDLTSLLGSLSS